VRRMQHIGHSLLFAVAIATACGDARADNGVTPVTVQNPITLNPATPNPVTIVNPPNAPPSTVTIGNPDAIAASIRKVTPYSVSLAFSASNGQGIGAQGTLPLPPAGKLLVVEYFAASCHSTAPPLTMVFFSIVDETSSTVPPNIFTANLPPSFVSFGGSGAFAQFGQPMRFYVGPNDVLFLVQVFADSASSMDCNVTISGQLIDS
jgi:hypothetical protein